MNDFSRTDRVGDQILKELAVCLQREVRDPRMNMVTVTAVKLTRDLKYGRVFVTFMGKESAEDIKSSINALTKAKGFFRSYLGKVMKLRQVPELTFIYDESVIRGANLSALIDKAIKNENPENSSDTADSETDSSS